MLGKLTTQFNQRNFLSNLLICGIGLRIFLFITLPGAGVDAHAEVINFIIEKGRLPLTREVFCAMHPPLYYLMATVFFQFDTLESQKITQILSLLLSCGNLYLLFLLCRDLFDNVLVKNISFLLAVFLHSFVTFSMYVSNDTLAFFLGTLIIWAIHKYISKPDLKKELLMSVLLGLGLLTKGTFLAFAPTMFLVILFSLLRRKLQVRKIVSRLVLFAVLSMSLGSYKFVENYINEGRPIAHNIDYFKYMPADTYIGAKSFYYFNIKKLLKEPTYFQGDPILQHVYPVIFYATFWYKFCEPFNGYELGSRTSFKYIGSVIYLAGIIPSMLIILGMFLQIGAFGRFISRMKKAETIDFEKGLKDSAWLSLLLMSVLLVIVAGVKYNTWVCFQSRLFLQAFFSILWLLYVGLSYVQKRSKFMFNAGMISMFSLSALYLVYYLTEGIYLLTR